MNKYKSRGLFRSMIFSATFFVAIALVVLLANGASATTIGTNIATQNTASASYFLTSNTIQVGGGASVAYNRFGTSATTHAGSISTTNDLLISGDFEVDASAAFDGNAYFGKNASISGILGLVGGQVRPGSSNSTTAFRFQNAGGTYNILTLDSTNLTASVSTKLGVNAGVAIDTTFEVGGTASISGNITLNGVFLPRANSTTAFRFQNAGGTYNVLTLDSTNLTASVSTKLGVNAGGTLDTAFEVGGTASVSVLIAGRIASASLTAYSAQFNGTATNSVLFGGSSTTKGACLQLRDTAGNWAYCRVLGGGSAFTCNTTSCR